MTTPRRRALLLATAAGAAAAVAACTDLPSSPDEAFSIEFESLLFLVVVLGDSLRDSTGTARPVSATAFNVDGTALPASAVQYLLVGAGATLLPGNFVRGDTLDAEVQVRAVAGTLPSLPRALRVVPRPDSLAGPTTAIPAIEYGLPFSPTADRSDPVAVRVLNTADPAATAAVQSWVVRYRLVIRGDTVPLSDTSLVWLVDDANRRSAIDTTDADGQASRRVRVNGLNPLVDDLDSVVVSVTAQGTRTPLRGAPLRIALPVRSRP